MPSISSKSSQSNPQIGNIAEFLQDPLKHAVSVMEKKLRNLEKRKIKLLETKKKAEGGNELNDDQKKALENLKVVENSLDLVKELSKNMTYLDGEFTKHLKRDQKRIKITEAAQSDQHGKQLVHHVVEVQAILSDMSDSVRPDFLNGANGACNLTKDDFDNLDVFYELVNPSIDPTIELSKVNKLSVRVKAATEHLIKVVEGKDLPALDNGTTYKDLHVLISRIKSSGYFEKDEVNGIDENVNHIAHDSSESEQHHDETEQNDDHEQNEDQEKLDHKEAENEEEEIDEITSPIDEQLPVLDGVDLPPEVQRTPNEEHFNFLSESEICVHGDGQQASLNPVSPEFVPRHFQLPSDDVYENGVADNSDAGWEQAPAQEPGWQSVPENQNFHSGGGFRGNRGNRGDHRGGRGFGGRGGRGSRGGNSATGGNFRGGIKQDGHRGGNRGGRGGEFRGGNRGGFRGGNRGGPRGAGRGGIRENKPQQQQQ